MIVIDLDRYKRARDRGDPCYSQQSTKATNGRGIWTSLWQGKLRVEVNDH